MFQLSLDRAMLKSSRLGLNNENHPRTENSMNHVRDKVKVAQQIIVIVFALPYHQTSPIRLFSSKTWKLKLFNLTNSSGVHPLYRPWNLEDVNSQEAPEVNGGDFNEQ